MQNETATTLVKFSGYHPAIDRWLQHRQLLSAGFSQLVEQTRVRTELPDLSATHYWCQELVDYLSEGHFQIFNRTSFDEKSSLSQIHYQNISDTTPILLKLEQELCGLKLEENARYDSLLSALGETLAYRIEIESLWIEEIIRLTQQEVKNDTCIN